MRGEFVRVMAGLVAGVHDCLLAAPQERRGCSRQARRVPACRSSSALHRDALAILASGLDPALLCKRESAGCESPIELGSCGMSNRLPVLLVEAGIAAAV